MPDEAGLLVPYVLSATAAGVGGGVLAAWWSPAVRARSAVQHFAAGVVIAAVASEMIPELTQKGTAGGILGGFAAGGAAMIALKWFVLRFEKASRRQRPVGLAATAAVDTVVDGAVISAGFMMATGSGPCSRSRSASGASESTVAVFFSFGAAALIYLIAEELLVESIQAEESLFSTAMLFAGFLVLLALKLVSERGVS